MTFPRKKRATVKVITIYKAGEITPQRQQASTTRHEQSHIPRPVEPSYAVA